MPALRVDRGIRLVSRSELAQDIGAFLVDGQARGLSPGTIQFYKKEPRFLVEFLEASGTHSIDAVSPTDFRQELLHLSDALNSGDTHVACRAMRTFLRWCLLEYDIESPDPITKVKPPESCSNH
jgi:site-specific recombinase XerC